MTKKDVAWLSVPDLSARVSAEESASVIARLIASQAADTQAELVRSTGLARSTVGTGLEALHRAGLVTSGGPRQRVGRGRPGESLRIDPAFGVVSAVEVGLMTTSVALYDFGQTERARIDVEVGLSDPPSRVIETVASAIDQVLRESGPRTVLRAGAAGVAAPVDIRNGRIVGPSLLTQWDDFPVEEAFGAALGCPVELRNDSGLRAFGEARTRVLSGGPLLYVRIGEHGIGAGFVDRHAQMVTGADGAAGEIGHMRSLGSDRRACVCGADDHLHSYGSVPAMVDSWRQSAHPRAAGTVADFEEALRRRDRDATAIAVEAGREIGAALTQIILVLNPSRVVLGGRILEASDAFLATIRAVVYETGLPLATRDLSLTRSSLGESAGLVGGLALALERSLSAESISQYLHHRR